MSAALTQYWTQVDGFSHLLSYVLLLMSLLSWTTILAKAWSFRQIRAAAAHLPGPVDVPVTRMRREL